MIDNSYATQGKRYVFSLENSGKFKKNETKNRQGLCDSLLK